jgi:hypothetical protein
MGPTLPLSRVVSLCGGLGLMAAFFMPWFSSQGLLLSGQFLDLFLSTASPGQLRQFLPSSSSSEVQALRFLVDAFPALGALACVSALIGGFMKAARGICNVALGATGVLALVGWAVGVTRLPGGTAPEIGLGLIGFSAIAVLLGLALELGFAVSARGRASHQTVTSA